MIVYSIFPFAFHRDDLPVFIDFFFTFLRKANESKAVTY